jgi:iron(III) transport system permease protein
VSAVLPLPAARALRQRAHWTDRVAHATLLLLVLALVAFLALPLAGHPRQVAAERRRRVRRPRQLRLLREDAGLLQSFFNSVWVSALVTVLTVPLAFGFAYAMTRSCIPARACSAPSP